MKAGDAAGLKLVADTVGHRSYGAGAHAAAVKAGATRKTWNTIIDGKERESHDWLDGTSRGIDEYFYSPDGARAL